MTNSQTNQPRTFNVAYWNPDTRVVDATKLQVETYLRKLGNIKFKEVKAPDDPALLPCDLLVVTSTYVPEHEFANWLKGQERRMVKQGNIWIPALFVADIEFDILREIWSEIQSTNWYFDIVSSSHLSSLPVRVANLMRIHDHLHELYRYGQELSSLQKQVEEVEERLKKTKS